MIACLVSAAVGAVLGITMSNGIVNPVNEMQQAAQDLAAGNLNVIISYESKDAVGVLAENLRNLTHTFKVIIGDVDQQLSEMGRGNFSVKSNCSEAYVGDYARLRESVAALVKAMSGALLEIDSSADQVNSGSEQVSSSAQALAQGATEPLIVRTDTDHPLVIEDISALLLESRQSTITTAARKREKDEASNIGQPHRCIQERHSWPG